MSKTPGEILFSELEASVELLCLFKEISTTKQSFIVTKKSQPQDFPQLEGHPSQILVGSGIKRLVEDCFSQSRGQLRFHVSI